MFSSKTATAQANSNAVSNKSNSINYKVAIRKKIETLFNFLRNVYRGIDNEIYEELNEEFEEELKILAGLIPNDWIAGFYDSVDLVFDLVKCLKPQQLAETIAKHSRARLWFTINSYNLFLHNFIYDKGYTKATEKAITNICDKFKPIFKAIDKLMQNPNGVLNRIALITAETTKHNDILNDLLH